MSPTPTLTAHFTAPTKSRPGQLIIGRNARTDLDNRVAVYDVDGKVAARKLAKDHGAKPWNF